MRKFYDIKIGVKAFVSTVNVFFFKLKLFEKSQTFLQFKFSNKVTNKRLLAYLENFYKVTITLPRIFAQK